MYSHDSHESETDIIKNNKSDNPKSFSFATYLDLWIELSKLYAEKTAKLPHT